MTNTMYFNLGWFIVIIGVVVSLGVKAIKTILTE
jgi:hypothetical protein